MVNKEEMASSPQVQFQESGLYSSDHCERLVCTAFFQAPVLTKARLLQDCDSPFLYHIHGVPAVLQTMQTRGREISFKSSKS